jgi:conjugative transfer pilus assembly protein TraH
MGNVPVQIYKCDNPSEDKCLAPTLQNMVLPKEKLFTQSLINSCSLFLKKFKNMKKSLKQEEGFVNATMIPVLKIIAVETAFKEGGSPISATEFSEAIAHDILLQYLDEVMSLVWDSVIQLKKVQINDGMIEELRSGIASSRKVSLCQTHSSL